MMVWPHSAGLPRGDKPVSRVRLQLSQARARHAHEHGIQEGLRRPAHWDVAPCQLAPQILLRRLYERARSDLARQRRVFQNQRVFFQACLREKQRR